MRHYIWILSSVILWSSATLAQTPKPKSGPLVINIDNPSFRKLAAAVPSFAITGTLGPEAQAFAKDGAEDLSQLLAFSGYFNIIAEAAYKDGLKKVGEFKSGMVGVDVPQWKASGVEVLTLAELSMEPGLSLSLKTIDMNRGEVLVSKKYSGIGRSDFKKVVRRYADAILSAYTGKPGIFNSRIVFIGRKFKGAPKQVYVADFDGANVSQITTSNTPHLSPEWSKDGRYITFTSYEDKNPDLFIYDTQTGKRRKLSSKPGLNSGGNWAPNNKLIAFTGSQDGEAELYLIRPDGSGRRLFIKGDGLDVDPAFSPDGNSLAFVSGRFGNPHIFVAKLKWENGEPKVLSDQRLTYAGWYNAAPSWSPEGDRIAFGGYDKDIDRFDIFTMDANGQNMERLTLKAGDNESPTWSPNGQLFYFQSNRVGDTAGKGPSQLYIMNRDGSGQRRIDVGLYDAQSPNWSPQREYD